MYLSLGRKCKPMKVSIFLILILLLSGVLIGSNASAARLFKGNDSLLKVHRIEYHRCKKLYALAYSQFQLPQNSLGTPSNVWLCKAKPYKAYTYKGLNKKDSVLSEYRIKQLTALSANYQAQVLEEVSNQKRLLQTKGAKLGAKEYQKSLSKLHAYERAKTHLLSMTQLPKMGGAAQSQNQLLQQIHQSGKLPAGMQTRKTTLSALSAPNVPIQDIKGKAHFIDSMAKSSQGLLDSVNNLLLDSLPFKLNPYATMAIIERFKPSFTWQNFLPQGPQPAVLELMPGIKFMWTPHLTPTFHFIYRQGLGSSLQQIQFTYQGYGFQLGLRRKVLEKGFVFAAWEGRSFPSESHTAWRGSPTIQSTGVLGLGYTAAISVLLLCDVKQLIAQRNYTAIRVQFNF